MGFGQFCAFRHHFLWRSLLLLLFVLLSVLGAIEPLNNVLHTHSFKVNPSQSVCGEHKIESDRSGLAGFVATNVYMFRITFGIA